MNVVLDKRWERAGNWRSYNVIVFTAAAGKYVPVVLEIPVIHDEEPTRARRVGELVRGHCRAYG